MTGLDLRPQQVRSITWLLQSVKFIMIIAVIPTSGFNLEPKLAMIFADPTANRPFWGRPSYFGYSTALQRNPYDNSSWLIVGAPRANSTFYPVSQIGEPGAIFKCDLTSRNPLCVELGIDRSGNTEVQNPNYEFSYHDLKNEGWLGGSLDSQPTFLEGRQATGVCAPRWRNQQFYAQAFINMNGVCYLLNASLPNAPANKKLPLIQYSKQTYRLSVGLNLYYQAHGQAGMSIHFPDDPTEMIVGAPGVFNWQGTVIRFKDVDQSGAGSISSRRRRQELPSLKFGSILAPNPYFTSTLTDFDLNGYAVTSGRFFREDELLYVSGAPKGANSYGKVIIFSFPGYEASSLNVREERKGEQLGENFGAALVSADVNGDNLSDLVVGSPTYFEGNKADMGRIHVFYSSRTGISSHSTTYTGSNSAAAKFGTALASPGDLNHDGYHDIAVGAPFENEGRGAVYIFMGSPLGLRENYAQRLTAADFPSVPLAGFGMSFSRGIDVDNNYYPDLAVGSFMSGHAIVLRSRAVAYLRGELVSQPTALLLNDTLLSLQACITYNGFKVPQSIPVYVTLILDYSHPSPRASFRDSGSFYKEFEDTIRTDRNLCYPYQVDVKVNKLDPRRPILVRMEYVIKEDNSRQGPLQPKTDPSEESGVTIPISIVTECEGGANQTCETDLLIEAAFEMNKDQEKLVIGKDIRPVLDISVHNLGESVFLPNVTVSVPPPFAIFLPTTQNCEFINRHTRTTMVCQLANPIRMNDKDTVKVAIDASSVRDSTNELRVNITAAGEGLELKPLDNVLPMSLQLQANAELKLHGYSREEQFVYQRIDEDKINTTLPSSTFTHFYTLVKSGPTSLGRVELVVDIPVNFTDAPGLITVYAPRSNFLGQPFLCHVEGTSLSVESNNNGQSDNNITFIVSNGTDTVSVNREDEVLFLPGPVKTAVSSEDSTLHVKQEFGCSNPLIRCAKLRCRINSWPSGTASAELSIRMDVNFALLAHHMSAQAGALIKSTATAVIRSLIPGLDFVGRMKDTLSINTQFLPSSPPGQSVAWWIILLAVLGGLLFLIVLAYLLYRLGFFKRKKQEELKAQRAHVESNTNYGATTADE